MTAAKAEKIFRAIREVPHPAPDLNELKEDLIDAAVRYSRLRVDWLRASIEERARMDAARTVAHDAFIDACNILSRSMQQKGLDVEWRADLGHRREEIGDFACYVHCYLGLEAR